MKAYSPQHAQPILSMQPSNSATSSHRQQELEEGTIRLRRLASVTINASTTKQGHRFYVVNLTRYALSAHALPTTYELEFRHSTLRHISDQIRQICATFMAQCTACGDMLDILRSDHIEPSRMQHWLPMKSRYTRLEKFINVLLSHTVRFAVPNAMICMGCEDNVRVVAEVLKEQYCKSTGII